jgi:uncharacterized membrane protein HdeD (DUF308 family)
VVVQQHTSSVKLALVFLILFMLGLLLLAIGVYLVIFMRYHERAYTPMALGGAFFISGIAGLIMPPPKAKAAFFYGMLALGIVGLLIGVNYLTFPFYHERGYLVLVISVLCIAGGMVGAVAVYPQDRWRASLSVLTLGMLASTGIVILILGADRLLAIDFQQTQNAYAFLTAGAACLLGGILGAIGTQIRRVRPILLEKKREL